MKDKRPPGLKGWNYLTRDAAGGHQKMDADALAKLNAKGALYRSMEVVRSNADERTVELAFSSEAEVPRFFGIEILDHSPESVRLDRLRNGGALLVNHDWDDQVGVVESVRIDPDRTGRAVVRFGRSARAQEIFQDVVDGIRKLVSVGYRVVNAILAEQRDGVDVVRITEWEPYEISLVSVPADASVGVGRSLENPQGETPAASPENTGNVNQTPISDQRTDDTMNIKKLRDSQGNLVRAEVDENGAIVKVLEVLEEAGKDAAAHVQRGADAERNRVSDITALGKQYNQRDLALEYIGSGKTAAEFQRALLDKLNEGQGKPLNEQPASAEIGMTDQQVRQFSFLRAVRAMLPNASKDDREAAAFEFECSRAAEKKYGKEARGILIPQDVLARAFNAGGAANTPTGATSGQNLVDTQFLAGSFIEALRNRTVILRLARIMAGLVGNVEIPKQIGKSQAYWLGEGQDATETTPVIGQIGLTPHTVGAYTDITRRLMIQSTPDAEGIVRADLTAAIAEAIDTAALYGTGASNQPLGLVNMSGINAVDFAAANPTYAELVQMETEIAADNADVNSMAYVLNAVMRGYAKTTPKFASGTSVAAAGTIWEPGNTLNGYRAEVTNQVQAGDVFFGNWSDLIVGMWGGLDLTVDPYSLSKSGGTRIVVFQDVDFAIRRAESFCYGTEVA